MNDLKVCMWPINGPIPYARNSRKIPERAIDKVAASTSIPPARHQGGPCHPSAALRRAIPPLST
jgi:hypothetical protein